MENTLVIISHTGTVYYEENMALDEVIYEYTKFKNKEDNVRFVYTVNNNGQLDELIYSSTETR